MYVRLGGERGAESPVVQERASSSSATGRMKDVSRRVALLANK